MPRTLFVLRTLFAVLCLVVALGCQDSTLGPVQTVDGTWQGQQNGYSLSLSNLVQTDTTVTGSVTIASVGGTAFGTVSGIFKYPNLHLTTSNLTDASGTPFLPFTYDGVMSGSEAKIFGKVDGSGLDSIEVDVRKK
jgi:hypothetical protein